MLAEVSAALLLGVLALWLVLWPLVTPAGRRPRPEEPPDPEETARGVALTALKEIEFDRETGKLSDADYGYLKEKYTAAALEALRASEDFSPDALETTLRSVVEEHDAKPKQVFQPLRVAITGSTVSPGIFESLSVLGRDETIARVERALERMPGDAQN